MSLDSFQVYKMKCLIFVSIILVAQNVASAKPQPTPVSGHMIAKTPMDKLALRIRHQNSQIEREVKLGKLTKAQAKTLKAQVDIIRKAEVADLKADNSKTLTDTQISQLNEQLNALSKSIPIK